MIKKTVTYIDFDGKSVTEDFYFNLTTTDVMKLEVSERNGFFEAMEKIVAAESGAEIIAGFERIVLLSYGAKDAQGRFYKNQHETDVFAASPAFSEIFMEMATNAEAGGQFVNQIVPPNFAEQVARLVAASEENKAAEKAATAEEAQALEAMQTYVAPLVEPVTVSMPTATPLQEKHLPIPPEVVAPYSATPEELADYEAWRAPQTATGQDQ